MRYLPDDLGGPPNFARSRHGRAVPHQVLEQLHDATDLDPFEVDQVIWYAKAVSGRVE